MPHQPARLGHWQLDNNSRQLTRLAGDGGAALEFRHLYRGYADFAVITKPCVR
jgi:hypothetical protein